MFDVGIAEEHAVSMAGGLAKQGMVPVVALYSTFLQRAYDMILQDICMLGLHVVFAVDRAGLVGEDGETHHGIYDIGFLRHAPGLTVLCPASMQEQQDMLRWATLEQSGPVAIRYPRGGNRGYADSAWNPDCSVTCHRTGADVTLITYGTMLQNVLDAARLLAQQGIQATVLRLLSVQPLPVDDILRQTAPGAPVVIVEEVGGNCGVRDALACELSKQRPGCRVDGIDLGCRYVQHGALDKLYAHYGLNDRAIAEFVQEVRQK
jgi:1-deoxy-D-xylulose-5-phosphate synthase